MGVLCNSQGGRGHACGGSIRGGGRGGHAVRCRIVENWNRLGSYTANAFSLYTLSQIISKWLISCCMCYSLTKHQK